MNERNMPRADVGAGTLSGVVASFALMILSQNAYNFSLVSALIGAVIQGLAGYLPAKHKSFWMGSAAVLGTLGAAVIGKFFFGHEWDNLTVSAAIGLFVPAFVAYLTPARNPDGPSPVIEVSPMPPPERALRP